MKPISLHSVECTIARFLHDKPTELFIYPDLREGRWLLSRSTMAGARFIGSYTKAISAQDLLADANFAVYEHA